MDFYKQKVDLLNEFYKISEKFYNLKSWLFLSSDNFIQILPKDYLEAILVCILGHEGAPEGVLVAPDFYSAHQLFLIAECDEEKPTLSQNRYKTQLGLFFNKAQEMNDSSIVNLSAYYQNINNNEVYPFYTKYVDGERTYDLTNEELTILVRGLEESYEAILSLNVNGRFVTPPANSYLTRIYHRDYKEYHNVISVLDPVFYAYKKYEIDEKINEDCGRNNLSVEIDAFCYPTQAGKQLILTLVNHKSQMIMDFQMKENIVDRDYNFILYFIYCINRFGIFNEIYFRNELDQGLVASLLKEHNIESKYASHLIGIDELINSL